MRREIILSELDTLATDIRTVVANEQEELETENRRVKEMEEARKKDKLAPIPSIPYRPAFLMPELRYFRARLQAITDYLNEEIQGSNLKL